MLMIIGSVRDFTLGNLEGDGLDQTFPTRTPVAKLRFS
jgi:hypothetical protein